MIFFCNSIFCFLWGNHQKHFYNGQWLARVVPWTNWILNDSWKAAHWKQTMRWILTWDLIDSLWGRTLFVVSQRVSWSLQKLYLSSDMWQVQGFFTLTLSEGQVRSVQVPSKLTFGGKFFLLCLPDRRQREPRRRRRWSGGETWPRFAISTSGRSSHPQTLARRFYFPIFHSFMLLQQRQHGHENL